MALPRPTRKSEIPFDYNINNRLVVRDNHRPLVPNPLDQSAFLPKPSDEPIKARLMLRRHQFVPLVL